jgi:uncharacterized protein YpiB (UPF0302 family)
MKELYAKKRAKDESSILDIYIEMIIGEAIFNHQLKLLEEKINDALDSNNKPLFLELSAQYAKLRLIV